jgi:hypothetical protein
LSNDIQKYEKQGLEVLGDTSQMSSRLKLSEERLELVHAFVVDNFREGIDYGPADPRNPKPVLLKPGAERLCKLFGTRPRWRMDEDTWNMLGSPAGTVCYICEMIDNTTGEIIGEGRGAEKIGNKQRDANKAIKIAEKCALIDCVLYTFGLSEKFTQDGAPAKNDLDAAKQELINDVGLAREGCESSMTDFAFILAVLKDYFHASKFESKGMIAKFRQVVLEQHLYDLSTGERIPE